MSNVQQKNKSNSSKIKLKKQIKQQTPLVYEFVQYQGDGFIENLAYMLIRPPRFRYNPFFLDPQKKAERFIHQVHKVNINKFSSKVNMQHSNNEHRKKQFQLSIYLPKQQNKSPSDIDYMILYLHGNSSSRLQIFFYLNLLPEKVGVACFDFYGCGNRQSHGKSKKLSYITLGKNQSQQVDIAARYLKSIGYNKVIGWGRSMGAVSLLLSKQLQILIVDSPYSNLSKLCQQSQNKIIPCYLKCFVPCFYNMIYKKVKQKVYELSGLQIQEMDILQNINKINQNRQICFVHGQEDILIGAWHSEMLYEEFNGRKQYILCDGNHNTNRSQEVIDACLNFIEQAFQEQEMKQVEKKSKLVFTRQKNNTKRTQRKQQMMLLNSLKKRKIKLPKLDQKYKNQKMVKGKQKQKDQQKNAADNRNKVINNDILDDLNKNQTSINHNIPKTPKKQQSSKTPLQLKLKKSHNSQQPYQQNFHTSSRMKTPYSDISNNYTPDAKQQNQQEIQPQQQQKYQQKIQKQKNIRQQENNIKYQIIETQKTIPLFNYDQVNIRFDTNLSIGGVDQNAEGKSENVNIVERVVNTVLTI